MRLACAVAAFIMAVGGSSSLAATGDPAVDALIDKLVEKKVITREDARELENELKKEKTGDPKGAVMEPAKEAQAETAKEPSKGPSKLTLPFELKVRAQTRLDTGDLLVGPDDKYRTETDLFLRRVRLEVDKEFKNPPVGKELDLNLTLDADRFDQDFRNGQRRDPRNRVDLHYLYGDWIFLDEFGAEVGKHKLPFLRAELTSSARQLLIERPASTRAANDIFGDYHQPQIMFHGNLAGGMVRYYISYADGANNLSAVQDLDSNADAVQKRSWGNAYMGRIEIAPFGMPDGSGFIERKKDDTGIGGESHLTLGIDGGFQEGIKYVTSSVDDARLDTRLISVDLAGRYNWGAMGTLTGQLEYINYKRDFNYRGDENPQGGYVQAGYLLPWTLLRGKIEPAVRYEILDHDRIENEGESGSKERSLTVGFNHYLLKHSIKWSYNFVHTKFDPGVAEAINSRYRDLHQLLLQLYF